MHFVRLGEFLAVSRITGPTHNLLQIRLDGTGSRPICERLPAVGGCSHKPLDEDALVRYVLEGVAEANGELGTAYSVAHIRYVENDTPPEVVYGFMAMRLIERLHSGGEFIPGGTKVGELPVDIRRRINSDFREDGPRIVEMLRAFQSRRSDIANERILRCIVQAASGDEAAIAKCLKLAEVDWRDLVMVAEYGPWEVHLRDLSQPFEE